MRSLRSNPLAEKPAADGRYAVDLDQHAPAVTTGCPDVEPEAAARRIGWTIAELTMSATHVTG
jgi:hypothetical protein